MKKIRFLIAQINSTVGDIPGNSQKVLDGLDAGTRKKADLVLFPEMVLTGYPPEDLLLKKHFIAEGKRALSRIARSCRTVAALVGCADSPSGTVFNAAAFCARGRVRSIYHKMCLPNYGVFDEKRYFESGKAPLLLDIKGWKIGITICEDVWIKSGPVPELARQGAHAIVVLNASPYRASKWKERQRLLTAWAKKFKIYMLYVNCVGGQDELVFDGQSMAIDPAGKLIMMAPAFKESHIVLDLPPSRPFPIVRPPAPDEEVYRALVLGTHDYAVKNSFGSAVIGLSGGIDSALTAAIAADALGSDKVIGVYMPSRFSSPDSRDDAQSVARSLGIEYREISIEPSLKELLKTLSPHFEGRPPDVTEENLQARIRGIMLMALSNKFGWLVLTTGNKSEMSTGYATLYGDMAGGFAVLKDVPKTLVYRLCRYRNGKNAALFSERLMTKEPTAELRHNQKDSDSLPPYPVLDPILKAYVEDDHSVEEIIRMHRADPKTVRKVIALVDRSEYKRRQSPPGVKITPKSLGKDRRMPITNQF